MAKDSQRKTILFAVVVIAVVFPLIPLFDHLGRPELGRPAFVAVAVLALTVKVCTELRGRLWFWISMVAIAACHVPLILLLPWPTHWIPAPVVFLFAIVDCAVVLAIIGLIEKLVRRTANPT